MAAQATTSEFSTDEPKLDSPLDVNEEQFIDQGANTVLINAVGQEGLKALKSKTGGSGNAASSPVTGAFAGGLRDREEA